MNCNWFWLIVTECILMYLCYVLYLLCCVSVIFSLKNGQLCFRLIRLKVSIKLHFTHFTGGAAAPPDPLQKGPRPGHKTPKIKIQSCNIKFSQIKKQKKIWKINELNLNFPIGKLRFLILFTFFVNFDTWESYNIFVHFWCFLAGVEGLFAGGPGGPQPPRWNV